MRIAFFDFDDTLFFTPFEEIGKKEWEEKTGLDFPPTPPEYKTFSDFWWKCPLSLDTEVFDIKPNDWIIEEYNKCKEEGYYLIMMTGRLASLKKEVENILNSNGLEFDELHFKPQGSKTLSYKIETLNNKISELQPDEVVFYDDREEHHDTFINWAKSIKGIKIKIINSITKEQFVNTPRVMSFNEWFQSKKL